MKTKHRIIVQFLLIIFCYTTNLFSSNNFVMNGTLVPTASFLGELNKERVGYVLSGAGDVNRDGYDDFLIGTFHNKTSGWDAGAVYLILGRPTIDWRKNHPLSHADARFLADRRLEAVGFAVAGNGDVNGDGFADIIIGSPAGNDLVPERPGKMYVVLGKSSVDWGYDCILAERADAMYEGENGQDLAGRAVAIVGDLNGDGCDEILCAAPGNDYGNENAGKVYLILGKPGGWDNNDKLANAPASFYYTSKDGKCGYSVAGVGDVNDDDIPDFAIGAVGVNKVFVMYGRKSADWGVNFKLQKADLTIVSEHKYGGTSFGWMVAKAGDVNGDNISDILISDIENNQGGGSAGKVYLILGRSGGWLNSEFSVVNADASYIGERKGDQAGWDVDGAGDVNGDGYDDFLIGARLNDYGYPEAGKAYLIYGKSTNWQKNVDLETIPSFFSGESDTNHAGFAVSCAGDVDGDEWDDYIISAPFNNQVASWSGKIYLFASQRDKHSISGHVHYFDSALPVPNALVTNKNQQSIIDTTDNSGFYQFEAFAKDNYLIVPFKQIYEDLNEDCISAYDAALVARQSVNLDTLSGLSLASADVNRSGKITTYDAALILQYAVGYPPVIDSHVGEWIFSPDTIFISNLSSDQTDQNFNTILRGDVDASWNPQQTTFTKPNSILSVEENSTIEQQRIVIPIEFENNNQIISFDIKIHFDPAKMTLIDIEKCEPATDFQLAFYATKNGVLKIGAYSIKPVNQGGTYIHLIFKAQQQAPIYIEKLNINDGKVSTSIISNANEKHLSFQLFQNYPNPFNGKTEISYQLAQPGEITFSIFNTLGQKVYTVVEKRTTPGNFQITWHGANNFGQQVAAGVYICQAAVGNLKRQIKLLYLK